MRLDLRGASAVSLIATLPACGSGGVQANNAASIPAKVQAPEPTPIEAAQRLVAQRLGAQNVGFSGAQTFTSRGATVVCGQYQLAGQPAQRFITVGEEDVFVEGEYSGDFGQAVAETCRNG